jgi:hypothetical protein
LADAYLNIAEQVLLSARTPLRPREIVARAYSAELLPPQLHGLRQDKTLHARLSEDISSNPEESRFFRTSPGVFFLQCFRSDSTLPTSYRGRYLAPPRRKELRKDFIMAVDLDLDQMLRGDGLSISLSRIWDALEAGRYKYLQHGQVRDGTKLLAVHSFVIVYRDEYVLTFRCGKFFPTSDPLYGRRSIGVGGAVFSSDVDMLYESMFGIVANGINELGYGIGLPRRLAERARYHNEVQPVIGVVVRQSDAHQNVLHVVMAYRCPDDFIPTKAALSVNDLKWINAFNPGNSISDYDRTSQFLFSQDYIRDLIRTRGAA